MVDYGKNTARLRGLQLTANHSMSLDCAQIKKACSNYEM